MLFFFFQKTDLLVKPGSTYIEFDDVRVPAANLLGQENRGFEIIMSSMSPSLLNFFHKEKNEKKEEERKKR